MPSDEMTAEGVRVSRERLERSGKEGEVFPEKVIAGAMETAPVSVLETGDENWGPSR